MNTLLNSVASETRLAFAAMLLAALPLAAQAQRSTQDSLLHSGDLVGGRPHASKPRTAAQPGTPARATTASADAGLAKMINESVDLSRASATDMPNLYSRFIEATRDQRRKWNDNDWAEASATLSRLNARYEAVRLDLPIEDRLRVRTLQGEFRTYENARRVNQKLDNAGIK
jgi:hypothetical protein